MGVEPGDYYYIMPNRRERKVEVIFFNAKFKQDIKDVQVYLSVNRMVPLYQVTLDVFGGKKERCIPVMDYLRVSNKIEVIEDWVKYND